MSDEIHGAFHVITIKVPVPPHSIAGASTIMAKYQAEFDALKKKLPDGSEVTDRISHPRGEETKPRRPRAVA